MSDNDKKPAETTAVTSNKKVALSDVIFGGSLRKALKVVLVISVVVLLVCTAWLAIRDYQNDQTVFIIDNKNYSKTDVDELIAYPVSTGTSKDAAASQAYEYLKRQAAAKKVDFEPTSAEIEAAKNEHFKKAGDKEKASKWAELIAYDEALENKLPKTAPLDDVKGYIFVFYFGNLIETGQDWQPANAGNRNMIAEERKYAQEQADTYHKQLKSKSAKPAELLTKLQADPKLNYQYKPNNNTMSTKLSPDVNEYSALPSDIEDYVTGSAPIGISAVRVGKTYKVTDYKNPTKMESRETYYYFTVLNNKGTAAKTSAFNKAFSAIKAQYKGYDK